MHKLIDGLQQFQSTGFGSQRELFERLAAGQSPETLFITCSDSRINPNLLKQTEPGEVFGYAPDSGQFLTPVEQRPPIPERKRATVEI